MLVKGLMLIDFFAMFRVKHQNSKQNVSRETLYHARSVKIVENVRGEKIKAYKKAPAIAGAFLMILRICFYKGFFDICE